MPVIIYLDPSQTMLSVQQECLPSHKRMRTVPPSVTKHYMPNQGSEDSIPVWDIYAAQNLLNLMDALSARIVLHSPWNNMHSMKLKFMLESQLNMKFRDIVYDMKMFTTKYGTTRHNKFGVEMTLSSCIDEYKYNHPNLSQHIPLIITNIRNRSQYLDNRFPMVYTSDNGFGLSEYKYALDTIRSIPGGAECIKSFGIGFPMFSAPPIRDQFI